jgi:hypothetical protein
MSGGIWMNPAGARFVGKRGQRRTGAEVLNVVLFATTLKRIAFAMRREMISELAIIGRRLQDRVIPSRQFTVVDVETSDGVYWLITNGIARVSYTEEEIERLLDGCSVKGFVLMGIGEGEPKNESEGMGGAVEQG